MRKDQGNRVGSASCSRLRLSCKKNLNNSKASTISNYFVKTKQPVEEIIDLKSSACDELDVSKSESPYQNFLAEIKPLLNDSLRDKSDFKTVEPLKCGARKACATTTEKLLSVKARKTKKSKQITMVKSMERNFCNGDTNGDHLQLALALSQSMQDLKNTCPKEKEEGLRAVCYPVRGTTILEQFGFNSGRKLDAENKIVSNDAFKKRKKSRYQYVTPVLYLRTEEDREKIIATKVSLILSRKNKFEVNGTQRQAISSLSSSYLQNLNKTGVYKLNQLMHEELKNKELFYLNNLKVSQETCASGYLLKDWNDIFGREATPPRDVKICDHQQLESNKENVSKEERTPPRYVKTSDHQQLELNKESVCREGIPPRGVQPSLKIDETKITNIHAFKSPKSCMSPDLFDSDDDSVVNDLNRSINEQLELSQRLINNFKSKSIFFNKSSYQEKPVTHSNFDSCENNVAKCLEYENRSGICHFESFQESTDELRDYCMSKRDAADLEKIPSGTKSLILNSQEIMQKKAEVSASKRIEKLHDFYDLTGSSDDESLVSYSHMVKSRNKSHKGSSVLENDSSVHFVESVLQEKVLASDKSDNSTDCELEISNTVKDSRITFNTSLRTSHHSSNKSESEKKLTQETISDDELSATTEGHFQKSNSSELGKLRQGSICISNKKTHSFLSDVNSANNSNTFVSESDENLSQQSDEEFQNKIIPPADCGSKNSLRNSLVSRSFEKFNSFSSASDGQGSFSDEELNYSSMYTKSIINLEASTSEEENIEEFCESTTNNKLETSKSNACVTELLQNDSKDIDYFDANMEITEGNVLTPENKFNKHDDKLIIKTKGITPMPNYTGMATPGIAKELQKFGIKNLKRRRGVEILHYIYDSTHPLIPERELGNISDVGGNPVKRRKIMRKLESKYNEENKIQGVNEQRIELVGDLLQENENDLIFEKKQSSKVASCRVPLHIAWFNLVVSHPGIRESILFYEPLQLEVLYSLLKEQGYKYSVQDLLTFLDKKCITIRINQNQRKTAQNRIKVNKVTTLSS